MRPIRLSVKYSRPDDPRGATDGFRLQSLMDLVAFAPSDSDSLKSVHVTRWRVARLLT